MNSGVRDERSARKPWRLSRPLRRALWGAKGKTGDEVGARMAFKEAYLRPVADARRAGVAPQ